MLTNKFEVSRTNKVEVTTTVLNLIFCAFDFQHFLIFQEEDAIPTVYQNRSIYWLKF